MKKIGILSPSGTGNLGDEATVAVLIGEIRRWWPSAEIYGVTSSPTDTRRRHNIPACAARNDAHVAAGRSNGPPRRSDARLSTAHQVWETVRNGLNRLPFIYASLKILQKISYSFLSSIREIGFLRKSLRIVAGTDLLIVAGSGQLCDNFYGVWGFPYTLLKWSIIAKLSGAKLAFLSCGAGPISSWVSQIFITSALRLADYRSFRDRASRELIASIGNTHNDQIFPDLVFGLKPETDGRGSSKPGVIAINPFPHYDRRYWPISDPDTYYSYIRRLASFAAWLLQRNYTVLLFPTQIRADPLVIEDIRAILMEDPSLDLEQYLMVTPTATFDDLVCHISMADIVVASRFHGVVVSFLLDKPVLALAHHPKVASLMFEMEQADYLLDIDTFDLQSVTERFMHLESNKAVVTQRINSKVIHYREALESQYGRVFGMSVAQPRSRRQRSSIPVAATRDSHRL